MKLKALANLCSKKEFYDLMEQLDHLALQRMTGYFTEKYPATDPFMVIRSLAWFKYAETERDPISLNGTTWAAVKAKVSRGGIRALKIVSEEMHLCRKRMDAPLRDITR